MMVFAVGVEHPLGVPVQCPHDADPGEHGRTEGRRALPIAHCRDRRLVPVEVWPNVGTFPSASLTDELGFQLRQPNIIRPAVAADCD
jgi:hypothetical protein